MRKAAVHSHLALCVIHFSIVFNRHVFNIHINHWLTVVFGFVLNRIHSSTLVLCRSQAHVTVYNCHVALSFSKHLPFNSLLFSFLRSGIFTISSWLYLRSRSQSLFFFLCLTGCHRRVGEPTASVSDHIWAGEKLRHFPLRLVCSPSLGMA